MLKKIIIILLVIIAFPIFLLLSIMGISQIVPNKPPVDFLITHNPIDLSQVDFISQFRSCNGHKSMSQWIQGPNEPPSSMAHYIYIKPKEAVANNVKIFAPFDGYINHYLVEGPVDNEESFALVPKSTNFPWWPFNRYRIHVSHAHTLPKYTGTAEMKAGDLIGYANIPEGYDGKRLIAFDFRMGVVAMPPEFKDNNGEPLKNMESVFNYMAPEVFAEYKAAVPGLESPQDFIISSQWRVTHPCKYRDNGPYFDSKAEDYITSKYRGMVFLGISNDPDTILKKLPCSAKQSDSDSSRCALQQ